MVGRVNQQTCGGGAGGAAHLHLSRGRAQRRGRGAAKAAGAADIALSRLGVLREAGASWAGICLVLDSAQSHGLLSCGALARGGAAYTPARQPTAEGGPSRRGVSPGRAERPLGNPRATGRALKQQPLLLGAGRRDGAHALGAQRVRDRGPEGAAATAGWSPGRAYARSRAAPQRRAADRQCQQPLQEPAAQASLGACARQPLALQSAGADSRRESQMGAHG